METSNGKKLTSYLEGSSLKNKDVIELIILHELYVLGSIPSVKRIQALCKEAGRSPSSTTVLKYRSNFQQDLSSFLIKSSFKKEVKKIIEKATEN